MMRNDVKLASYRLLAGALQRLPDRPWQLLVAGDGDARRQVEAAFAPLPGDRVRLLGECDGARLATLWAAADVCAWPAIGEAYGMALLEAQAAGVPVLAGRSGGVAGIVADGESGVLVKSGDMQAFADGLAMLLADESGLRHMGRNARERVRKHHDLRTASRILRDSLAPLLHADGRVGPS